MQEIWKDIEGYENLYQVSNLGRVKSLGNGNIRNPNLKNERILKARDNKGYLQVGLSKDGKKKRYQIHRLVAIAFIHNPNNYTQVNHKDEDKTNNMVENLEWCDCKYNINYGTRNKRMSESLTNNPKRSKKVICVQTGVIYPSVRQVERELGFNQSNISAACRDKLKQSYGFHWKYID